MSIVPWILRNYYTFGTFNLTNRGDVVLLMRAYGVEKSLRTTKETIVYSFSEYLGSKFFPHSEVKSRDFLFMEDYRAWNRYRELDNEDKSPAEVSRIIKKEAISRIKSHPIRYLLQTPVQLLRLMSFMYIPALYEKNIVDKFKNVEHGLIILSAFRGIYKMTALPILFFSLIGIFFRKIRWRKEFMILLPIIYINFVYSLLYGYPRYAVPLVPFYFIFATMGVMKILKRSIP